LIYINTTSIPRPPTFTNMTPLGQYYIHQTGGWRRAWHRPRPFRLAIRTAQTRYRQFSSRAMEDRATRTVERYQVSRTRGVVHRRKYDRYSRQSRTVDILSKHATETTQNIIKKLRGGGRNRKRASSHSHKARRVKIAKRKSSKRKAPPKTIKRDIFS